MSGDRTRVKLPKQIQPRSKDEILVDFTTTMKNLAESSYLSYVYAINVKNHNERMVSINQELAAREKLDAPKKDE